ncbi:MAG TPA: type II toxin-antitoxin system VapC family toxin [Steroidobacteraceae bacterium]|nr:type II toxin-antitoxin system VapC family toxin [Steroidobacteraceae bacterium]
MLLDTEVALWVFAEPSRLASHVRRRFDDSQLYMSAATMWEISIKASLGRIGVSPAEILVSAPLAGLALLPITAEHVVRMFELPPLHDNQIDRMLVAQAYVEPMYLVTNDPLLQAYGSLVNLI